MGLAKILMSAKNGREIENVSGKNKKEYLMAWE